MAQRRLIVHCLPGFACACCLRFVLAILIKKVCFTYFLRRVLLFGLPAARETAVNTVSLQEWPAEQPYTVNGNMTKEAIVVYGDMKNYGKLQVHSQTEAISKEATRRLV